MQPHTIRLRPSYSIKKADAKYFVLATFVYPSLGLILTSLKTLLFRYRFCCLIVLALIETFIVGASTRKNRFVFVIAIFLSMRKTSWNGP